MNNHFARKSKTATFTVRQLLNMINQLKLHMFLAVILATAFTSCTTKEESTPQAEPVLEPVVVTDTVRYDSDDPAIWVNRQNPAQSLILGTDKMEGAGALFAFDLEGATIDSLVVDSLDRPNNVAVAYDLPAGGDTLDVAIVTERINGQLRLFSLPSMQPVDGGGVPVFVNEPDHNLVMGVAVYQPSDSDSTYVIVSRKSAPDSTRYLHQYALNYDREAGHFTAGLVRTFGRFEGSTEIEAIAVDNRLGYVYYSDEGYGIRKYYAEPDKGNQELAVFGTDDFTEDREGIAIYPETDSTGYIIVSNQQGGQLNIYPREGTSGNLHNHPLLGKINYRAISTDGIEATSLPLSDRFPEGFVVAMSENKTFELYDWKSIEELISTGSTR